jgi:poly(3-hydroxybutyrate) depolymerase
MKSTLPALFAAAALIACSSGSERDGDQAPQLASDVVAGPTSPSPVATQPAAGDAATPAAMPSGSSTQPPGPADAAQTDPPVDDGSGAGSGTAGTGGMGAMGVAGAAGNAGDGGDGGDGSLPPAVGAMPSAGCSAGAGRPAGGLITTPEGHYFAFPQSYDGTQPLPVLMGFHGCGGVNRGDGPGDTEYMRLTAGTAFESEYVRVVPRSSDAGGCWSYGVDLPRVRAMYDELAANHCIDRGRVFATGHSSGAQLIVQILLDSHTSDAEHFDFAAVAPVAASDYGPMRGPVPVMYIQGMMDRERGNGDGHETVERFRAANGCMDASMPYAEVTGCQSGATTVDPGCVIYDGCQAPTVWCSHDDPAYSGTMHGVPCFAMGAIHDFFEAL